MDQTAPAAAAATASKSRKRRRNHQRTSTRTISSGTSTTLPRVTTAPANLGRAQPKPTPPGSRIASSDRGAGATAASVRPPVSPPFASSADLDAQISTLDLINKYGYGPVPGTPLLRAKTPPAPGRPRSRTRDALKSAATVVDVTSGSSAVGSGSVTDRNPARNNTADTRMERPSRLARGPWMGTKVRTASYVRTHGCSYWHRRRAVHAACKLLSKRISFLCERKWVAVKGWFCCMNIEYYSCRCTRTVVLRIRTCGSREHS